MDKFDISIADAQATAVEAVAPADFDFEAWRDHEAELLARSRDFMPKDSGIAVYRRVRAGEVFLDACRDKAESLALQLGALQKSMLYQADIPNFLEPWYGIGVVSSAFGAEYIWNEGQAPATKAPFNDIQEALDYPASPIAQTPVGRHILETIDYFLEQTRGELPISLTDVQSPLNAACELIGAGNLMIEALENPEGLRGLLEKTALLAREFIDAQLERLGSSAAFPGHGFASCRCFGGLGMSDDYSVMLSPDMYADLAVPAMGLMAGSLAGPAYHSCGNWGHLAPTVRAIPGLLVADGAFGPRTDPMPNEPEAISDAFRNTGIAINARIVGGPETVLEYAGRLWQDGVKLIVVTYCETPEQQRQAYRQIHALAG